MPKFIGIAGIPAGGKTTYANKLSKEIKNSVVISTDSFLYSNTILKSKGLLDEKGAPETYNNELIQKFLGDPYFTKLFEYDHKLNNLSLIEVEVPKSIKTIIIEGTIALTDQFLKYYSKKIFIDTKENIARERFISRTLTNRKDKDSGDYYRQFDNIEDKDFIPLVIDVFDNVSLKYYKKYVEETKKNADMVIINV